MAGLDHDADVVAGIAEANKDLAIMEKGKIDVYDAESDKNAADGIHDGLEFPSDEDLRTLRHVPDDIPWNAYCALSSPSNFLEPNQLVFSNCICRVCRTLLLLWINCRLHELHTTASRIAYWCRKR